MKRNNYPRNIGITVCSLFIAFIFIYYYTGNCSSKKDDAKDIYLQDTPISIESIRPKGELYVGSSILEDYVSVHKKERHLGIIPETHSCVQIMRQKCSYKIDLDKVVYTRGEDNIINVSLPELEYVATTQNTPFVSDDEEYWIKEIPNTNNLKEQVEKKIKRRFDTPENRRKATRYAEDAVAELLKKCGYQAEFKVRVEQKRK